MSDVARFTQTQPVLLRPGDNWRSIFSGSSSARCKD